MCKKNEYSYLWLNGELTPVDRCIAPLILQLNMAGIKTLDSCCGHGKSYPVVICEAGTKEGLQKFGCKIAVPRESDGKVMAYFPVNSFSGKVYPVINEGDHHKPKDNKNTF